MKAERALSTPSEIVGAWQSEFLVECGSTGEVTGAAALCWLTRKFCDDGRSAREVAAPANRSAKDFPYVQRVSSIPKARSTGRSFCRPG